METLKQIFHAPLQYLYCYLISHFGYRQWEALDIFRVLAICCFRKLNLQSTLWKKTKLGVDRMEGEVEESVQGFEKWRTLRLLLLKVQLVSLVEVMQLENRDGEVMWYFVTSNSSLQS